MATAQNDGSVFGAVERVLGGWNQSLENSMFGTPEERARRQKEQQDARALALALKNQPTEIRAPGTGPTREQLIEQGRALIPADDAANAQRKAADEQYNKDHPVSGLLNALVNSGATDPRYSMTANNLAASRRAEKQDMDFANLPTEEKQRILASSLASQDPKRRLLEMGLAAPFALAAGLTMAPAATAGGLGSTGLGLGGGSAALGASEAAGAVGAGALPVGLPTGVAAAQFGSVVPASMGIGGAGAATLTPAVLPTTVLGGAGLLGSLAGVGGIPALASVGDDIVKGKDVADRAAAQALAPIENAQEFARREVTGENAAMRDAMIRAQNGGANPIADFGQDAIAKMQRDMAPDLATRLSQQPTQPQGVVPTRPDQVAGQAQTQQAQAAPVPVTPTVTGPGASPAAPVAPQPTQLQAQTAPFVQQRMATDPNNGPVYQAMYDKFLKLWNVYDNALPPEGETDIARWNARRREVQSNLLQEFSRIFVPTEQQSMGLTQSVLEDNARREQQAGQFNAGAQQQADINNAELGARMSLAGYNAGNAFQLANMREQGADRRQAAQQASADARQKNELDFRRWLAVQPKATQATLMKASPEVLMQAQALAAALRDAVAKGDKETTNALYQNLQVQGRNMGLDMPLEGWLKFAAPAVQAIMERDASTARTLQSIQANKGKKPGQ